jgi:pyruvoyl-dependent arginine decarboxylase (PvlArgDC)
MRDEIAKLHVSVFELRKLVSVALLFGSGMAPIAMIFGFSADSPCVLNAMLGDFDAAILTSGIHDVNLSSVTQ